jgi:hypothetical protein
MILSKVVAAPLITLLGPGHYVLHVDKGAASVQRVVGDHVLDDKGQPLASLLNLTMMCEQVPHA